MDNEGNPFFSWCFEAFESSFAILVFFFFLLDLDLCCCGKLQIFDGAFRVWELDYFIFIFIFVYFFPFPFYFFMCV